MRPENARVAEHKVFNCPKCRVEIYDSRPKTGCGGEVAVMDKSCTTQ